MTMSEFSETNKLKNEIEDSIVLLLDDLRNGTIYNIRSSFTIVTDREN